MSGGITDPNVTAKTTTFLEESIGIHLCDLGLGNGFLETIVKHKQ